MPLSLSLHKCRCPCKLPHNHWCLGYPHAQPFLCLFLCHQTAPCVSQCTWRCQSVCPLLLPWRISASNGRQNTDIVNWFFIFTPLKLVKQKLCIVVSLLRCNVLYLEFLWKSSYISKITHWQWTIFSDFWPKQLHKDLVIKNKKQKKVALSIPAH